MRFVYIFSTFICFSPRQQTVRTGPSPHSGKHAKNASQKPAKGSHTKKFTEKVFNTYVDKIYNKLIINILQYGKSGLKVGDKQVENRPGKDGNAPQNAGIKAGLYRLQKSDPQPAIRLHLPFIIKNQSLPSPGRTTVGLPSGACAKRREAATHIRSPRRLTKREMRHANTRADYESQRTKRKNKVRPCTAKVRPCYFRKPPFSRKKPSYAACS